MKFETLGLLFAFAVSACSSSSPTGHSQPGNATPATTPVGDPAGAVASSVVGASGGSVQSADGVLTLTIPDGALSADTTITILPLVNHAPGGVGSAYRLGPEGVSFAKPVQMTWTFDDTATAGTDAASLGAAFQTPDHHWQWEETSAVDESAKTASAMPSHFSDWSLVKGFQLQPPKATVKVNETVSLRVVYCYAPWSDLGLLAFDCDPSSAELAPLLPVPTLGAWMVNGVAGGNAASGTIAESGKSRATYTAPSVVPDPSHNPVSVSVQIDKGAKGKTLVVSSILVSDSDVLTGTFTYSFTGGGPGTPTSYASYSGHGQGSVSPYLGSQSEYKGSGTFTFEKFTTDLTDTCSCSGTTSGPIELGIMYHTDPTYEFSFGGDMTFDLGCVPKDPNATCQDAPGWGPWPLLGSTSDFSCPDAAVWNQYTDAGKLTGNATQTCYTPEGAVALQQSMTWDFSR